MKILGIESTCDEMAASVVEDGHRILSNVISSQSSFHKRFGGVYPEMAARQHVDLAIPTVDQALKIAGVGPEEIALVACAREPGLIGPLFIGLSVAKTLAIAWNKHFLGVNHVEAHLYGAMMSNNSYIFPSLGLVVSGGHTFLVRILGVGKYEMIGTTVDDALGEAFDKVANLLDLPYPGGPEVERLAKRGDFRKYPYRAGRVKGRKWDFSFSGLKTNVLYTVKGQNGDKKGKTAILECEKADVAASFQEAALKDVADKARAAAVQFGCKAIYVGGGVSHNQRLREMLVADVPVFFPGEGLSADNGAMLAGLAFHQFDGQGDALSLEPKARISFPAFASV